MLEAGLNELISAKLGDARLVDIVARMDTGDRNKGKMAFVKTLDLLPDGVRQFIRIFSKLRNDLVHDVRQFEFSFSAWITKMPAAEIRNFQKYLVSFLKKSIKLSSGPAPTVELLKLNPRYIVQLAAFVVMFLILEQLHSGPEKQLPA